MARLFGRRNPEPTDLPVLDPTLGDPAAVRLMSDMDRRDWRSVHNFLSGITDPDHLQHYLDLCVNRTGVQAWIEEWIQAEPRSHLPFLVGGAHAVNWAWLGRGTARAKDTLPARFKIFARRLRRAHALLVEATVRAPDDPTAWSALIICGKGMGLGVDEAVARFREATARHRWHYGAHLHLLDQLLPKWGGSAELAHRFAAETAASAPASSGLATLVVIAHLEHWVGLEPDASKAYLTGDATVESLNAAADASVRHADYRGRLGWQYDFNYFAMPFWQTGQWDAAGAMFDALGDQVTEWPWRIYNDLDVTGVYARARDEVAARRTPRGPTRS